MSDIWKKKYRKGILKSFKDTQRKEALLEIFWNDTKKNKWENK